MNIFNIQNVMAFNIQYAVIWYGKYLCNHYMCVFECVRAVSVMCGSRNIKTMNYSKYFITNNNEYRYTDYSSTIAYRSNLMQLRPACNSNFRFQEKNTNMGHVYNFFVCMIQTWSKKCYNNVRMLEFLFIFEYNSSFLNTVYCKL